MATATITKQSVIKLNEADYTVVIHAVFRNDAAEIVIEKDYSERYYSALSVDTVKAKLQDQMIIDWDEYIAEQALFDAAAFDTMISEIQTAANTYINQ